MDDGEKRQPMLQSYLNYWDIDFEDICEEQFEDMLHQASIERVKCTFVPSKNPEWIDLDITVDWAGNVMHASAINVGFGGFGHLPFPTPALDEFDREEKTDPGFNPEHHRVLWKEKGLCPDCGDPGEWRQCACFCPTHGKFLG